MSKIKKYHLISSDIYNYFNDMIQEALNDDWSIYGNPSVSVSYDSHNREFTKQYIQAMVKYEKD